MGVYLSKMGVKTIPESKPTVESESNMLCRQQLCANPQTYPKEEL